MSMLGPIMTAIGLLAIGVARLVPQGVIQRVLDILGTLLAAVGLAFDLAVAR